MQGQHVNVSQNYTRSVLRRALGRALHPPVCPVRGGGAGRGALVQGAQRQLQGQGQGLPLRQQRWLQCGGAAGRGGVQRHGGHFDDDVRVDLLPLEAAIRHMADFYNIIIHITNCSVHQCWADIKAELSTLIRLRIKIWI